MHPAETETLDRRDTPHGEVVLRRQGELLQIIANGTFLMDTSDGRSERLLVRAALAELDAAEAGTVEADRGGRAGRRLLLGGLGVGFSLAEAAAEPRWSRITVVEREQAVVDWHRADDAPFAAVTADALRDPRTRIVHADLVAYLHEGAPAGAHDDARPDAHADALFDVIALDIDNGPGWTVDDGNDSLYSPAGLAACARRLTPGGVLAVWSAQPSRTFEDALAHAGFARVRTEEVRVARGVPDAVHFATKPA